MTELYENLYYRTDLDESVYLFNEGKNYESYEFLGAHKYKKGRKTYTSFTVYAPMARELFLIGDFNFWNGTNIPMKNINNSGIWNVCIENFFEYYNYKYRIISQDFREIEKSDPYAFYSEFRPNTASKVFDINGFKWSDSKFMKNRMKRDKFHEPMSIYELHLGSWMRHFDNNYYTYDDLCKVLPDYVKNMGFTHVEIMPLTEYPFDGSWGYQVTGYFSITSRYGDPKGFMRLVDEFHKRGISVILDWVPVHFTRDAHGLSKFDGSEVFEKNDEYRSSVEGWGTLYFDFYKQQVKNFLISSALFLLKYFHIDGLRVDAVSAMLYLNYGGKNLVNEYGGHENLEAIEFVKELNSVVHLYHSDTVMIAEESTAFPNLTKPVYADGLGFDFKWNMGWMNDTLYYMEKDPAFRKYHHDKLTFSITYCFSENYILPFSHDEVVHLKKSMINKMPGDYDTKFRALRALYAYQYAHPGKKLMFMGDEIGTFEEWNENKELSWSVLNYENHRKLQDFVKKLNEVYKKETPLHQIDDSYDGYNWIEFENSDENIIAFERIDRDENKILCFFNFSPIYRHKYRYGVDHKGIYKIVLNSAHKIFGGEIQRNTPLYSIDYSIHGKPYSIDIDLPPYQALFVKLSKKQIGG
ncbi:1,4-alpha-glucan branching protein GlgB [Helcococcus bovis]|uniref:1,4-alpha-glucan branching protein GlgB n=1 Tax=Helcococcus bovis TaxID=3153252 RepID=UPI0038BBE17B